MNLNKNPDYQKHEAYGYLITLNSNQSWTTMNDEIKLRFKRFVEKVFSKGALKELFVYRPWITTYDKDGRRRCRIDGVSETIKPRKTDIVHLDPKINFEVGLKQDRLHAHIFVTIGAKKYNDLTITFDIGKMRELFESCWGYKCHLNIERKIDQGLLFELYARKSQKVNFPKDNKTGDVTRNIPGGYE